MSKTKKPKTQIRPPTSAAVAGFVAKGDARPKRASQSDNKLTKPRKGVVTRVHKGDLARLTAYLDVDLDTEVRARCGGQRIDLSEAVSQALRAWLTDTRA